MLQGVLEDLSEPRGYASLTVQGTAWTRSLVVLPKREVNPERGNIRFDFSRELDFRI